MLDYSFNHDCEYETFKGASLDSLYRIMMHDSDNFIAEQLLIQCANSLNADISTRKMIEKANHTLFSDSPDDIQWFDGSGLSRYNLATPRSIVSVLENLLQEQGLDYIRGIFPAGGNDGTISEWYKNEDGVYIFAKSGTLRNRYCLSGYLITESGKTLIFSFMNNNYIGSPNPIKKGMQRILKSVYKKY